MSNQNEFNTKAIELTHDDLESVVGGSGIGSASANAGNAAQASNAMAAQQMQASNQMAMQKMQTSLNDAMNNTIKNIGGSIKKASQ
jgi:hypothetical protein